MTDPACTDALNTAIDVFKPRTMLALGAQARAALDAFAAPTGCYVTALEAGPWLSEVDRLGTFDFVFVAGVVEHLPKSEAITLLGRLRDLHTHLLYLLVPIGAADPAHTSAWEQNDLIALGMEQASVCAEAERPLHLYKFDLLTYKRTPEWLNSQYWAHPELWDKY